MSRRPVRLTCATSSTALPVLVSVTALVCGTFRGVAKLTEASTEACGSVPVPVRLTAVGDAGSLLEIDSTPVSGPGMVGANETVMSQLLPGAIVPEQPLLAHPESGAGGGIGGGGAGHRQVCVYRSWSRAL